MAEVLDHKRNSSVILDKNNMPDLFCHRVRVWSVEANGLSLERAIIKLAEMQLRLISQQPLKDQEVLK